MEKEAFSKELENFILSEKSVYFIENMLKSKEREIDDKILNNPQNTSILPMLFYLCENQRFFCSERIKKKLSRNYESQLLRTLYLKTREEEVIKLLQLNKIKSRVLKGSSISNKLYPLPELRPSKDIDICVKEEDFKKTIQLLQKDSWTLVEKQYYHYLLNKNGISLEIHRNLFSHAWGVLFNIKDMDHVEYIEEEFSMPKLFVFLLLKLFCEGQLSLIKLYDLFLFKNLYTINDKILNESNISWNYEYAYSSLIRNFEKKILKNYRLNKIYFVFCMPNKKSKIESILFPDKEILKRMYDGKKISKLVHIKRMLRLFLT